LEPGSRRNCIGDVAGFADDLDVVRALRDGAKSRQDDRVVIYNQ
jgi:hypothetical protein